MASKMVKIITAMDTAKKRQYDAGLMWTFLISQDSETTTTPKPTTPQLIQGDIMFARIEDEHYQPDPKLSNVMPPSEPVDGRYVIARGEKTGHVHTIDAKVSTLFGDRDVLIVDVDTEITHNEHPPLMIPVGTYSITRQRTIELRETVEKEPETRVVWD